MLRVTLTLSAIYLAAVGLGLMIFPLAFGAESGSWLVSRTMISLPAFSVHWSREDWLRNAVMDVRKNSPA